MGRRVDGTQPTPRLGLEHGINYSIQVNQLRRNDRHLGNQYFRNIGRAGERGQWANSRSSNRSYYVSVRRLDRPSRTRQGLGLDINPYAIGKYRKDYDTDDTDRLGDFGLDARYRLTPSLTALASVNTDFAETETDTRQVNFSRFPLFSLKKAVFLRIPASSVLAAASRHGGVQ